MKRLPGFRYDSRERLAYFEVTIPGTKGKKRRRATVEADDLDAALKAWRVFRAEALDARKKPKTLRQYVAKYGDTMMARLSPKGAETVEKTLKRRLLPHLGDVPLQKINAAVIRDLVGALLAGYDYETEYLHQKIVYRRRRHGVYSASSINGALATLRKVLRDAVDREELDRMPFRGRLPFVTEPPLRLEMTPAEMAAFLGAFDDEEAYRRHVAAVRSKGKVATSPHFGDVPRIFGGGRRPEGKAAAMDFELFQRSKPLFVVALESGLRQGDLLRLKWTSVDFRGGWLRVAMEKTRREALIPISQACRSALLECRSSAVVAETVFLTCEGRPYSETTVNRYFKLAKALAGIKRRLRFHDLRHSFGSRLASAGVSLQNIARALGHTSARMAERYARPSDEAMRSIAGALDSGNSSRGLNSDLNSGEVSPQEESSTEPGTPSPLNDLDGGRCRIRTDDHLRVKQALYRLS